jgi:NitT/TauT family transport system substrate-binding protein
MSNQNSNSWSRREFLNNLGFAGAAALLGLQSDVFAAEPAPETTKLRLDQSGGICTAPQYVAEQLLRGEGFTDVQYVKRGVGAQAAKARSAGEIDIDVSNVWGILRQIDAGDPVVFLAGIHIGCYELFGNERIRSIRELKGKNVAVSFLGSGRHLFLASMATHVV